MHKAAQSLHTSYNTFKKYAKKYDVWKPRPSSAGISRARKVTWSGLKPLDVEIDLQKQLIKEFVLPQRCSCCGESRQRKTDLLTPLIVHFINGDINDKKPSNLRFFCYNCYFLEHPNKHKTIEDTDIMLHMVAANRGITALPLWLAKQYTDKLNIKSLRLGEKGIFKSIHIGIRDSDKNTPYLKAFIDSSILLKESQRSN